jgi:acyl-CoA reductase-like NAD-dependent aldehyde dehydrogenase
MQEGKKVIRAVNQDLHDMLSVSPLPMYINGTWTHGSSGTVTEIIDPANSEVFCAVSAADEKDVDTAANAAYAAFKSGRWSGLRPDERARAMFRWADLVDRDSELLAEMETLQTGKPIRESRGDIARGLDGIRFYAGLARNIRGETIDVSPRHHSYVTREPIGVIASIVPWNVPFVLTLSKAAPALAGGNSVIVKPSQTTPLTALHLARLWEEAGLPTSVFSVITGAGRIVGEALCMHPRVSGVTFTGSTETGLRLSKLTSSQNKRIMLELGGKSPNLVLADADLDRAIPGAASAIFYGQGQICAAGSRLIVDQSIYDQVVEGVVAAARGMVIGDPLDPATEFGTLTSQAHRAEVLGWVDRAVADGATVATGGRVAHVAGLPNGAFMEPTVLVDVKESDPIAREEVFGPVLVVQRAANVDDAIRIANDSQFGLSAAVWTRNAGVARRVARELESGVVWINDYGQFNPAMPFGGVKLSGSAHREWSHLAIDAFLEHKSIWEWNE